MKFKLRCLIVSAREEPLTTIESVLSALPDKGLRAENCEQAGKLLCSPSPVHVVLTDVVLPDGNWLDVLDFAKKAKQKVNVIVISPRADVRLYVDAINHGAFDFITETFTMLEIAHVLRAAIDNACQARGEWSPLFATLRRPGLTKCFPGRSNPGTAA